MKVGLFDFQEDALTELRKKLTTARSNSSIDAPQSISFSAPTGSGKTIIMIALFEDILFGQPDFDAQSDATILWISDMPELNEQTRLKIEGKSDRIRVRQLVNIETSFDAERLDGGHIYFINTQKLGNDKLLTQRSDERQFTIWETFTNTAKNIPDRFYVVIDEAHRGMGNGRAATTAQTILQRFLLGSPDDGLCQMPLVVGMSATPQRFQDRLSKTTHTLYKVYIKSDNVRESGLLKDRILIHYPESDTRAEMTLLTEATKQWQLIKKHWTAYCNSERESEIRPIMVIQVEDGIEKIPTRTDLNACLATIESNIGRKLRENEVAHTFNDRSDLDVNGYRVRYIEASRIEEERSICVVLFKMNLSTGWDCPRAEVMMSFRRAQDHTYIAQLLGRMVRAPLARRVEADAALNDVHLFLPYYDQAAVESVIQDLKNVEDVPPSETGTSRELVTLNRRAGLDDVFNLLRGLPTYRVNAVRKQSALRRLMGLAYGLTHDKIDKGALGNARALIINKMAEEILLLNNSGLLGKRVKQITGIDLKTIAVEHGTGESKDGRSYTVEAVSADIDRHFHRVGRWLGNGLEIAYWKTQENREANEVKVEVVALADDAESMKALDAFADVEFNRLYEKNKRNITLLKERRRQYYKRLCLSASEPQPILWNLPDSIDSRRFKNDFEYDKHLYLEDDGKFRTDLGTWEHDVLVAELKNESVVGWLRNLDRKPWSLEIPYKYAGSVKSMFPDLVIVRTDSKGFLFDILEPHDSSLNDNVAKAFGLAEFAQKHWGLFDRIQMIRKKRGADGSEHYFRLDVGKAGVQKKVLAVTSDIQLNQLFDSDATV